MIKNWLTAVIALSFTLTTSAQTLFSYGDTEVDAKDFVAAYNKNNSQSELNRSKAIREYLQLYINSRLKIKEAYARGYDKLPQIRAEVENLRSQIIDNYLSDPDAIERLTKEAFQRSQKDIHVSHLFISTKNAAGELDTVAAKKKLAEVMRRLKKGDSFSGLVKEFSDEPGAAKRGGDMGWITVFSLPYEFENVIYTTPKGKYSEPYHSKAGYHIFKNTEERKAFGKIKIAQILLAFPPDATEGKRKEIKSLADSLFDRLKKGDDFGQLASKFSTDYISAANGGIVPEIGVGKYDQDFEKVIWSLSKDGDISKPFLTAHGYHIVKRISRQPVVTDPNDESNLNELKQRVSGDDRWRTARDFIYERVKKKAGFTKKNYNESALWAYSDSVISGRQGAEGGSFSPATPLFTIGDTTITVMQWIAYAQAFRYRPDRTGLKPWPQLMDEFTKTAMFEYYRDNLEEFNEKFARQMAEFRDGNLFFEIMQTEVWNKAQSDSAGLRSLFERNRSHYDWKPSADVIVFFSADEETAKAAQKEMKKNPSAWRKITESMNDKLVSDSARYEWEQIPGLKGQPRDGMLTTYEPGTDPSTSSISFAYVVKVYNSPAPRSFEEAKGLVINDYQNYLEEEWLKKLKEKYPVKVNEKVLAGIAK